MDSQPQDPTAVDLSAIIDAHVAGDRPASEQLCGVLAEPLRIAARKFLGDQHPEVEDVIQESTVAVLQHITRSGGFSGNLFRFSVTVARNRCRNLLNWRRRHPQKPLEDMVELLANPAQNPLEVLLGDEALLLLQQSLDELGADCRDLLESFYLRGEGADSIRRRLGLSALQSVYYRKAMCLDQAGLFLEKRLAVCSRPDSGSSPSPTRRSECVEGEE